MMEYQYHRSIAVDNVILSVISVTAYRHVARNGKDISVQA